jgi:hypothetical protein
MYTADILGMKAVFEICRISWRIPDSRASKKPTAKLVFIKGGFPFELYPTW